jgi:hypothetical protein
VCGNSSAVHPKLHLMKNFIAIYTEVRELFYLTVLSIAIIIDNEMSIWSTGGLLLTGENGNIQRKTCPSDTFFTPYST